MKPGDKVEIGNAVLFLGDNRTIRKILPREGLSLVSDPIYGIKYVHSGTGKGISPRRHGKIKLHGDNRPFNPRPWLIYEKVLLFGANHYARRLPNCGTWIAWDKACNGGPHDKFSDAEFIWTSVNTARNVIRYQWKGLCTANVGEENGRRYHPTQKPLGLMKTCVEIVGGDTIFDPFMGSGSTGVAALQLGKKFIGIEIDPVFFNTSCRRINEAQRQQQLFGTPEKQKVQERLFTLEALP